MTDLTPTAFLGHRIIENASLTEAGEPYEVRRPWRERLFSRPWRPWKRTRTVVPQVPYAGAYQLSDGTLVMHPTTLKALRQSLGRVGGGSE